MFWDDSSTKGRERKKRFFQDFYMSHFGTLINGHAHFSAQIKPLEILNFPEHAHLTLVFSNTVNFHLAVSKIILMIQLLFGSKWETPDGAGITEWQGFAAVFFRTSPISKNFVFQFYTHFYDMTKYRRKYRNYAHLKCDCRAHPKSRPNSRIGSLMNTQF